MTLTDENDVVIQGTGTASKASLITLGIVLTLVGALALWASFTTTLISVLVAGALILVGAVFQAVLTFQSRKGAEIVSHGVMALLYALIGLFLILNPVVAAISLTSLIGVMLIAGGVIRIGSALYLRDGNWGWSALTGVVSLGLGIFTMMYLPEMSFVLIGAVVAMEMIVLGTTLIGYGLALPSLMKSDSRSSMRAAHI
jgi:uncharacterized membrane protein HdeD (DUF308 family)